MNLRVGGNLAVRALGDLAAEIEHDASIGNALDHAHLMLDDDDRQVLVALAHEHNVVHQLRRFVVGHAGGWLIEQQQPRRADERAADFDAAAVDHWQPGDRLVQTVRQRRLEYLDQRTRGAVVFLEFPLEIGPPD